MALGNHRIPKLYPVKNMSCQAKGSKNHPRPSRAASGKIEAGRLDREPQCNRGRADQPRADPRPGHRQGTSASRTIYIGRIFKRSGTWERTITRATALNLSPANMSSPRPAAASLPAGRAAQARET